MNAQQLSDQRGAVVVAAYSSLTQFSCELQNGKGIVLDAASTPQGAQISHHIVDKSELPRGMDAVCKVDWSWIIGSSIKDVAVSPNTVRFTLDPAGPLTISVQLWQGKPFLAFQPYRPAT